MKFILISCYLTGSIFQVKAQAEDVRKRDTILLNDVVITGQYQAQSMRNAVQRVRMIGAERIKARGATDLLSVLNTELGVRFSNDLTLGETDVQLMGVSGQNVKVLLDGIPLVDRGASKQSLSQVDINTVERIELVEGPMSVVYGTDALGGVVNIITKKGSGRDKFSFSARIQEESMGKRYDGFSKDGIHNGSFHLNYSTKAWDFSAGGTRNTNGSWQNWKAKDQWLGNTRIGYRSNHLSAWYRLDYLDESIQSPGAVNPSSSKTTDQDFLTGRYTHQFQLNWMLTGKLGINTAVSYQDYSRRTLTTDIDHSTGKRTLNLNAGAQDVSSFTTKFLRSTLQYRLSDVISFQPGLDIKLDQASGQRISGSPEINDYSFFGTSEINLKAGGFLKGIKLKPGVRFSINSVYEAPPLIPSLNTKFSFPGNIDLRLSYSKGFRAPALRELYFNFFDASHSIRGNENLKAERSDSYTGSISWGKNSHTARNYTGALSGFYNTFRDQITYGTDPNDPTVSITINNDRYETTGLTFDNTLRFHRVEASAGFSFIGRFNLYYEDNPSLKKFLWSPELNSNLLYRFPKAGTSFNLAWKYSGKLPGYQVSSVNGSQQINQTEIGSFHLADAAFTKSISRFISINAGIRNLFNVTNLSNTSTNSGAHTDGSVPMSYGRSFFLGINLNWTRNRLKAESLKY